MADTEIDSWLRDGGIVVTASDRAARALTAAYHRARRAEGLTAWPAPRIQDWKSFAHDAWSERNLDGRLLLNPWQEESLWEEIAGSEKHPATYLEPSRRRIASLAAETHEMIASYAPAFLKPAARSGWQQDAAAFSGWLRAFDETCRAGHFVSASRLPLELIAQLEEDNQPARPPLLAAGFDRILPVQRSFFGAWSAAWREASRGATSAGCDFYSAPDEQSEIAACSLWCHRALIANPGARLLIVTQEMAGRRGEIERALLKHLGPHGASLFEFSLGVPLGQVALARAAHLMLRWLAGTVEESELDWLLSTGYAAVTSHENAQLQHYMRRLRHDGDQRTSWTLEAFTSQRAARELLPPAWFQRMNEARQRLAQAFEHSHTPLDWSALAPELLKTAGWPGCHALSSLEFQAQRRFQQAADVCASLGFDGRRIRWPEFISSLARALDKILFAPESHDAPIQIVGPAESAGLTADGIWFLGADDDAWPAAGSTHPFLPLYLQRQFGMPHASPQLDWQLARAIGERVLASAPQVHFSHALLKEGVETRPSRLVAQLAGEPTPLPSQLRESAPAAPATVFLEDSCLIPFTMPTIAGGAAVLTAQSQCPFRAFAAARLGAEGWDPAVAGLSAAQRGQLIHSVMHAIWAGPPRGLRTLDDLRALPDLASFVADHVVRTTRVKIPAAVRDGMPRRYLDLEQSRLGRLVTQWLEYESGRHPFEVIETEAQNGAVAVAGLTLQLRLDRIDRLNNGTLLVVDYKTGNVKPGAWDTPRPDDVQLPLYATFALDLSKKVGGLAFAKIRAGEDRIEFAGRLRDAAATLIPGLRSNTGPARYPLDEQQLEDWREEIERLARDFIAGRAEVDPKDYPETCEHCEFPVLCRVHENHVPAGEEIESEDENDE